MRSSERGSGARTRSPIRQRVFEGEAGESVEEEPPETSDKTGLEEKDCKTSLYRYVSPKNRQVINTHIKNIGYVPRVLCLPPSPDPEN